MKINNTIALITCYIGKLPWYFNYFIHSCSFNATIDFYIITDDVDFSGAIPPNVYMVYKDLDAINQVFSQRLNIKTNIRNGYKLCDFKPAYGLIFADLLKGYAFWGHCDIDIIFGDIREFITDDLLSNFELISVRHDWLSGCFLLYKNSDKLNLLFTHSKDHLKVFEAEKHYCFDETNFAHDAFTEGLSYENIETEVESMMHVVKRLEKIGYVKPFFDFLIIEGLPGKLKWENGKMFYRNQFEILFYHLIFFKTRYKPQKKNLVIPGKFTISPLNIYHSQKTIPGD